MDLRKIFEGDDDWFTESIQKKVLIQTLDIIKAQLVHCCFVLDFYPEDKQLITNFQQQRNKLNPMALQNVHELLAAVFRHRFNRMTLFRADETKIIQSWQFWLKEWLSMNPAIITKLVKIICINKANSNTSAEFQNCDGDACRYIIDQYGDIPWLDSELNHIKRKLARVPRVELEHIVQSEHPKKYQIDDTIEQKASPFSRIKVVFTEGGNIALGILVLGLVLAFLIYMLNSFYIFIVEHVIAIPMAAMLAALSLFINGTISEKLSIWLVLTIAFIAIFFILNFLGQFAGGGTDSSCPAVAARYC